MRFTLQTARASAAQSAAQPVAQSVTQSATQSAPATTTTSLQPSGLRPVRLAPSTARRSVRERERRFQRERSPLASTEEEDIDPLEERTSHVATVREIR